MPQVTTPSRDPRQSRLPVVVVGAGIGGLATAIELAARGAEVIVVERAAAPGGKMRVVEVEGRAIDSGPTVLTMRWVFEELFARAGASLDNHLSLEPSRILARHSWGPGQHLDLHADLHASADAIARFSSPAEGRRYLAFAERARGIYETLDDTFMRVPRPSNPLLLAHRVARRGLGDLLKVEPFATLWRALGASFDDPRLRQLFGRYATYVGSSPFEAPATLMLIAHAEREGVWLVEGGMHRLARALADLAGRLGVTFRYRSEVTDVRITRGRAAGVGLANGEPIEAAAVVLNADVGAAAAGYFGDGVRRAVPAPSPANRSLSAVTWSLVAETDGMPLARHNVFFSNDYGREFDALFRRRQIPDEPTVYICAQDRDGAGNDPQGGERLFCLINAPPCGDQRAFDQAEVALCEKRTFDLLDRHGLRIKKRPEAMVVTTPRDFESLFPATGGALYGQTSHGWMASFRRPAAPTRLPGLFLAGGSVHPGAGVPMAALSGRIAAEAVLQDLASILRSHPAATPGGMSTR